MSQQLVDYGVRLLRAAEFVQRVAGAGQEEILLWLPHALAAGHVWLDSEEGRVTALGLAGPAAFRDVATLPRLLPTDLGRGAEALYVCWFGAERAGSSAFRRMLADCRLAWPGLTHVCARRQGRQDKAARVVPMRPLTEAVEV